LRSQSVSVVPLLVPLTACAVVSQAAIGGQCAKLTQISYPFPPPGVRLIDLETLRVTNYTRGAPSSGSTNFAAIFSNRTATAAYAEKVERARTSVVLLGACEARLSPTLAGVFLITLATLLYGFWRRTQLRRLFTLPGDTLGDLGAWLFCSCCTLCQEYRTLRLHNVEFGQWGGNVGWLLDGGEGTIAKPPPDIEMSGGAPAGAAQV
jgi:Cys-rich protein (TIGR01571 family)